MTRISIVTPSFNQGRYIDEALESVQMQRHAGVEHLVFDGGSTDETVPLLQSLDRRAEWSHVHWSSGPDGGQSDALNKGFAQAKGDIVGWLNSDDRYRPGCFDHVVEAFDEYPDVDVFYGDYALTNQDGTVLSVRREIEFNHFILLYNHVLYIPTTTTFFRRRIFEEGYLLKPELHWAMDYEFFVRLATAGYRFQHIPQVLADFRLHPASKTGHMSHAQAEERQRIMFSVSPVTNRLKSAGLRRIAFFGLEVIATLMRWFQRLFHGHYLIQLWPGSLEK